MALTFAFELVTTNDAGVIQDQTDIDAYIINKFTVDETVGDELYLKSGDLLLNTNTELTHNGLYENWIFFYVNDDLFNVYYYDDDIDRVTDQKRNLYRYRFISIQQKFYNDASLTSVTANNSDTDYWNYGLNGIAVDLYMLHVMDGDELSLNFFSRYAYPLAEILSGLAGKTNDYNYEIDTVTHNIPTVGGGNYELPVLWRGRGVPDSDTDYTAIVDNFFGDTLAESYQFQFQVTGVGVIPEENSVYSNNGSNFITEQTEISGAAGTMTMRRSNASINDPGISGTLTKVSGTGDASITFLSVSDVSDSVYTLFGLTWWDLLKIASIYENSFISVKPKDDSGTLKIDLSLIPRVEQAGGSEITNITWVERKKTEKQYIVDGVTLSTLNYEYKLGDTTTPNQFSRSAPVAEGHQPNSNFYLDLYIGVTEQDSIHGSYDYTEPDDVFYVSGGTPEMDAVYQDIIDGLDGYEGKILPYFDDGGDLAVRLLDQIELPDTTKMQITSIKIKKRGFATIKAMELS